MREGGYLKDEERRDKEKMAGKNNNNTRATTLGGKGPLALYLLWRHVEWHGSEIDLPVGVDARDHEEDTWSLGTAL